MSSINLTQAEAQERSALIEAQHYSITLNVLDEERFTTQTLIKFSTRRAGSTFIDLRTDDLLAAVLDDSELDISEFNAADGLPLNLSEGEHTLMVTATGAYSRTGEGLHRAVDPADGNVYLYTQFETADAKRVFACFDQPDMKATYDFKVITAAEDKLITNEPVNTEIDSEDGTATHTAKVTYPLSTYLIAFCIGPYAQFTDTWRGCLTHHPETPAGQPTEEFEIPLAIYSRASLAEHVDVERLFRETKQGFDFYHQHFGVRYPFRKYDQVFVPEFNAGAMENAGCVTIRDEYIFTSQATHYRYERRADTILHEMAHMWFGDLVTMRWWGDLWLNESFATWSAAISQAEATDYSTAWVTFNSVEKAWAYAQDQLPTTHPISTDASDIETVEQNFDGITYAKGASVLRQLQAYVGREEFFAGVRRHFAAHSWSNATFGDLLEALEKASGRDLSFWADQWLKTTGVNRLRAEFNITDGTYSSFSVRQSGSPQRTHRLGIGIYSLIDGSVQRTAYAEIDISGELTLVAEFQGIPAGDLVIVNDEDLSYALIELDDNSLSFIQQNIEKISNPMARSLCWSAAWEMTRDGTLPAREFITLVARAATAETELGVLEGLLNQASQAQRRYADPAWAATDDTLVQALLAGATGDDNPERALVFEQALAQLSLNQAATEYFAEALATATDADAQWRALTALVARGERNAQDVEAQLARDNTASGHLAAEKALAARPDAAVKQQVVEALLSGELSNLQTRHQVAGFNFEDSQLSAFNSLYFEVAEKVWAEMSTEISHSVLSGLYPTWDISEEGLARADEFLARDNLSSGLRRLTLELRDRQARALRNRRADAQAG